MPANNPTPGATPIDVEVGTSELEVELEAPAAAATTAVTTADVTTPTRGELVSVYLLAMHLPSADLIADDYTDADRGIVRRIKEWRGENTQRVAREIETMRRGIYRRIERVWCMVKEFGVWITVSEEGIREAERLMKEVRDTLQKIGLGEVAHRYFVRAIRVYLEPSDAKMLLDAAVSQLNAESQELERRIKDAEVAQNKRLVKELMYKREYVKYLLSTFKKYIENINS
jgi:hypothetical protein